MRAWINILAAAVLLTGCDFKSSDPVVTTNGNPAGLFPTAPVPVILDLSWAASTGTVQGYKVEVSFDGSTFVEKAEIEPNLGDAIVNWPVEVSPGRTYFFRVRSFNQGGNSSYSSVVTIKL